MIRLALDSDLAKLKALWEEAFGDTPEDTKDYFARRHQNDCMLVDVQGTEIAGMLSLLPVTLVSQGREFPARYIYGVATRQTFRGQGISTRLMEYTHDFMREMGEKAAILVPASQSLFDFYGKRGYKTVFALDTAQITAKEISSSPMDGRAAACDTAAYTRIRDKAFSSSSLYARWDERAVDYAATSLSSPGGILHLQIPGGEGCALWESQEDGILVRELALVNMDVHAALFLLHTVLKAPLYRLRLAAGSIPGAAHIPFGMIHWLMEEPGLSGGPPYLSLALD
jgi:predicted N-acetyltransferase YhbS